MKTNLRFFISGADWTGLASDPLSRTVLDQDRWPTDLDWTFQTNPFHSESGTLFGLSQG